MPRINYAEKQTGVESRYQLAPVEYFNVIIQFVTETSGYDSGPHVVYAAEFDVVMVRNIFQTAADNTSFSIRQFLTFLLKAGISVHPIIHEQPAVILKVTDLDVIRFNKIPAPEIYQFRYDQVFIFVDFRGASGVFPNETWYSIIIIIIP